MGSVQSMTYFAIAILPLFLQTHKAQDNNFVPPIVVTCQGLPEDTGGVWNCEPDVHPGYPVHPGTRCTFICNGTIIGTNYCSSDGLWNLDPNSRSCQNGSPSTTMIATTSTSDPNPTNCPFKSGSSDNIRTNSLYCPQSYCPAVFVSSNGPALQHQPDSVGCFNYEGSLMADEYPIYINSHGRFLTPHAYSNPVIGYTVWLVSDIPLDTNGTIRNNKHDDMFCPYDMLDGWEFLDKASGDWVEDPTLRVNCVQR